MTWAATEAKAKFSEVLDRAEQEGPQIVRRRKHVYLIMTREEHDAAPEVAKLLRKNEPVPTKYQNLVEFFRNSPLAGIDLETKRPKLKPRHIEL
jgi:prevent-host-death family protein